MNPYREKMLKDLEASDLALFEKIKNNPRPDPIDLWGLSSDRFIEWRRIHDFPVLLKHFDKVLPLFVEWKGENALTNEIMIESGELTPFLERKKLSKNKSLYLVKQNYDANEITFVAYKEMKGEETHFGKTYKFEVLQKFTSYLDWLTQKGKDVKILNINSRHAPESDYEKVFIHADVYAPTSDFELLKMGGIDIPVNGFGLLFRGKKLEFVNLCGLRFVGEIHFGELGNLSCSYCACDNWIAQDFEMATLDLEHCSMTNFIVKNSKLQQWTFYDTNVTGDFVKVNLTSVRVFGGSFAPIMQDCSLFEVTTQIDQAIADNNYYAYKTFKKIYANQGEDDKAQHFFILENEHLRHRLKGWNYFTKSLSYYYWEYGRKPHRIIYYSIAIILGFGLFYWLYADLIALNSASIKHFGLWDAIYFSTTTYTTLGYGDLSPLSGLRILTSIEALLGVINMGFLIAGYSNNKY